MNDTTVTTPSDREIRVERVFDAPRAHVFSVWTDPADTEANVAWTRELFEALEPFFTGRRWLNYLGEDDMASASLDAAYGPNQERLAQIKAAYDPTNLFRLNLNVEPAA